MPLMEWDESYSVGVAAIDAQHMELIAIIDKFAAAFFDGESQKVLGDILDRLIEFTQVHFHTEENLMIEYGYEELFAHREEHKYLTQRVLELQELFEKGNRDVAIETFNFLRNWLMSHILKTDMEYKEFFRQEGVE